MNWKLTALPTLLLYSLAQAAPTTVLLLDEVYEIAANGTWTRDVTRIVRINEPQAINSAGQTQIRYSGAMQTVRVIEAYTKGKDGMRSDVPADKMVTQQHPMSSGVPTFKDDKILNVVFPQVEVGAELFVRYRITQIEPFLPGVISLRSTFGPYSDYQAASVTLRAPQELKLHLAARGMQGGEARNTTNGMREWRWDHGASTALLQEAGSVSAEDFQPFVMATVLANYPDLAKAYMIKAAPAAKTTPAVQKLADEITAGITNKRARAEAIYRWVSSKVSYINMTVGVAGYWPHTADQIIAANRGDSQDKATLLVALLNAKGIRAMPALINPFDAYRLPERPQLSAFDHVVTYLPEWNLFVDASSGFAPFGILSPELMDKQALLGGDAAMKPALKSTPAQDVVKDRVVLRTIATLAADGTVSGVNHIEAQGANEYGMRSSMAPLTESNRKMLASAILSSSGQTGTANLLLSDVRDLTTPLSFKFEFNTPGRVNLPGPGALPASFGIPLPSGAESFTSAILRQERKLDFACPIGGAEEHLELALPEGVSIASLPKGANLESPYGKFTATFAVQGQRLLISRRMALTPPHTVCTPADGPELRRFATAISEQLRAQVLYQ